MITEAHTSQHNRRTSRWMWILAVLVLVFGGLLSFMPARIIRNSEDSRLHEEFSIEAENLYADVTSEIELFMDVLDSIRLLHSLSDQIHPDAFSEFVAKGMRHQIKILGAYGFAQRIPGRLRDALAEGEQPLILQTADDQGTLRPAPVREEYYVLTYQTPENGLGAPPGFDFSSRPSDVPAIQHLLTRGTPALAGHPADRQSGYYIFMPILYSVVNNTQFPPPGYLIGFTVAIFNPTRILEQAVSSGTTKNLRLSLENPNNGTMHWSLADVGRPFSEGIAFTRPLQIADQEWTFKCVANQIYMNAHRTRQPQMVMGAGIIITLLIAFQLFFFAGRTRQIERTVHDRTLALQEANEQLASEMNERSRLEEEILDISAREKQRVGRDLHDSVGQKLAGVKYLSKTLEKRLKKTEPTSRNSEDATQINNVLKEAIGQVRRIAHGLAPVELSEKGLHHALHSFAEEAEIMFGITCTLRLDEDTGIVSAKVAEHLYQIAQEATNNAVRHGKASDVRIALTRENNHLVLSIQDNGSGLPTIPNDDAGMGLKIMQYRAAMIHGKINAQNHPDGGAMVQCIFE